MSIMCLSMMWKILTAQIREEVYYLLVNRELFVDKQKGCQRETRRTSDLLYIDQHILKESKRRQKNGTMASIDYIKAYDTVRQSWIVNCQKVYNISDKFINFIRETMKNLKIELTVGGKTLAEVKIQRDVF